jgi:hypothetical protein
VALAKMTRFDMRALNPFKMRGTALPPNVLLAAKLVTIVFLIEGQWRLTQPFLPFIGLIGDIGHPAAVQHVLQYLWLGGALCLLANRAPRASCGLLGGVLLFALLSSHAYRTNNLTFTAALYLMIACSTRQTAYTIIRWQLVVLYFFAGMNRLLDAGWRSGSFFESWNTIQGYGRVYHSFASLFPSMFVSATLSWAVIITELFLAVAFAFRKTVVVGILLVVAYHSSLLLLTGSTFTMFWYALVAACIALVRWPEEPPLVEGADTPILRALRLLDVGRAFRWNEGGVAGLRLTRSTESFKGRGALARIALYHPAGYIIGFSLLAMPQDPDRRWGAVVAFAAVAWSTAILLTKHLRVRARIGDMSGDLV